MHIKQAEERLTSKAFEIFKKWRNTYPNFSFNPFAKDLVKYIENNPLEELLSLRDLEYFYLHIFDYSNKDLDLITIQEFTEQFRAHVLTTKIFDCYMPIYCLFEFPYGMKIGCSTVKPFEKLPTNIQKQFISIWKRPHPIGGNYYEFEDKEFPIRKNSTFIEFEVKANGEGKAFEIAKRVAEDCLNIIRFIFMTSFELIDIVYLERGSTKLWAYQELAPFPFYRSGRYIEELKDAFSALTEIFTKPNSNELERRIVNAVRIFGIQTGLTNNQIRLTVLMTCIESLLMTEGDKDYLRWKLAERAAFVYGRQKKEINNAIKDAYNKRSAFVHGKKETQINERDIEDNQKIVSIIVWRLFSVFLNDGYTQVPKSDKLSTKSIDDYIEQEKFGEY